MKPTIELRIHLPRHLTFLLSNHAQKLGVTRSHIITQLVEHHLTNTTPPQPTSTHIGDWTVTRHKTPTGWTVLTQNPTLNIDTQHFFVTETAATNYQHGYLTALKHTQPPQPLYTQPLYGNNTHPAQQHPKI